MDSSSQYSSAEVGSSSTSAGRLPQDLVVIEIVGTNRASDIFQNPSNSFGFELCRVEPSTYGLVARCRSCRGFYRITSNSTLRRHMQSYCSVVKATAAPDQNMMADDGSIFHYELAKVRDEFAKYTMQECLPFDHFDNPRFTKLVRKTLQPKYTNVSRNTLRRDCIKLWRKAKEEIILGFENLNTGINITTDVWSAPHGCNDSYICVTAHWVNPQTWQMMKRTIAFEMFAYPHTGINLYNILCYVFGTFKIDQKIFSISFDNASNNTNAVGFLKVKNTPIMDGAFYHSRCMAHIINLAVQDGLNVPAVQEFMEAFKQMLRDIYKTSKRRHAMYIKFCNNLDATYLGPNLDCPTRWNSTHHMLQCALRQRETLKLFHEHLADQNKVIRFHEHYWVAIEELTNFLEVFKTATTCLSGVYYPTSPLVLQHMGYMSEALEFYELRSSVVQQMTEVMRTKLQKYFLEIPSVFSCAAALNPCINVIGVELCIQQIDQNLKFFELRGHQNWSDSMIQKFSKDFKQLYEIYNEKYGSQVQQQVNNPFDLNMSASSSSSQNPSRNFFNRLRMENVKRQRGTTQASEFGMYTGTDFASNMTTEEFENFDILAWWKGKETQFPILAAMARDLLTVQASTVASESAFSVSGRVISLRRTKLTPTSVETCICLKDHLDAAERIQHISSLEEKAPYDIETRIHDEEVAKGEAEPMSEEELQADMDTLIGDDESYPC